MKTTIQLAVQPEIKKLQPNSRLLTQLLGRMAGGKEIRKTGRGEYALFNGVSPSVVAPSPRAAPGFVQRIAHIEHMLEQLMKALEVKESR